MKALGALYSPVPCSRLGNYFQQLPFRVLEVKRRPAGLDLAVGTVYIPLPDGALGFHATWDGLEHCVAGMEA